MSDSSLFRDAERVERCLAVRVTEDNILAVAKHFGWSIEFKGDEPRLMKTHGGYVAIGKVLSDDGTILSGDWTIR